MNESISPERFQKLKLNADGYPDAFASMETKKTYEWNYYNTLAFHEDKENGLTRSMFHGLFNDNRHLARFRGYGRGEQDPNQYKELMGLKKNNGKFDTSFRNLDWSILPIMPKMKNTMMGIVFNDPLNIKVKPIDSISINKRQKQKFEHWEYVINQDQIAEFQKLSGQKLDNNAAPGTEPPISMEEIEPYMDMHPKDAVSMDTKDYLNWTLALNNWTQQSWEVLGDIIDTSLGIIEYGIDAQSGLIKFKRRFPERSKTNHCVHEDFSDLKQYAYYEEMSLQELRVKMPWMDATEFQKMVNELKNENEKYNTTLTGYSYDSHTFSWDKEAVTVMHYKWLSTDQATYMHKVNKTGNKRVFEMPDGYVPFQGDLGYNEGKGMSDDEYNEIYKGKKRIIRKDVTNVYRCSWIVGTKYIFDYGMMNDMERTAKEPYETKLPVAIMSTDFKSTVSLVESLLDQFQLNYLQYQSHVAASKPDGLAIEKRALAKVGSKIRGGAGWDPKEDLQMYAEIGSFVFDGYDMNGQPLPWLPVKEIKNGLSESAFKHFELMIGLIDLMRNVLGINQLVEGEVPAPRTGKKVAEIAVGGTNNALTYLKKAYRQIFEKVCQGITNYMPDSVKMNPQAVKDTLGVETAGLLQLDKALGLRQMGIVIEEGPDNALINRISEIVNKAVDKEQLMPEDGIYIEQMAMDNPYKAIMYLRKKRREVMKQNIEATQQKMAAESQSNEKMMADKAQAELASKLAVMDKEIEREQVLAALKEQEMNAQLGREILKLKLEKGIELDMQEKDMMNGLVKVILKGEYDLDKANIGAKAKAQQPKPKPKAASTA